MDTPEEGNAALIDQLYSMHRNDTRGVPADALVRYLHELRGMVAAYKAFVNGHPEVVKARLQERVDAYRREQRRNPTPVEITAQLIFEPAVLVLQDAALAVYSPSRVPDFKFHVEVITGIAGSYIFLTTGIRSLRNTIPELIDTFVKVGNKTKGEPLTEEEKRGAASHFFANGRLAESQLIIDPTGFRTVDSRYRTDRMTHRYYPSRSYIHLGSKLFRGMYKAAYPLAAELIARK